MERIDLYFTSLSKPKANTIECIKHIISLSIYLSMINSKATTDL